MVTEGPSNQCTFWASIVVNVGTILDFWIRLFIQINGFCKQKVQQRHHIWWMKHEHYAHLCQLHLTCLLKATVISPVVQNARFNWFLMRVNMGTWSQNVKFLHFYLCQDDSLDDVLGDKKHFLCVNYAEIFFNGFIACNIIFP